jgi:hypothetical protein
VLKVCFFRERQEEEEEEEEAGERYPPDITLGTCTHFPPVLKVEEPVLVYNRGF